MERKASWEATALGAHYGSTETEDGLQALKTLGIKKGIQADVCRSAQNSKAPQAL